ncbi:MAG: response regulator transcription factor [Bdellovibrionales bacterium]|nr:response regulator transcription factor [Bdellovibrionales bacterium]
MNPIRVMLVEDDSQIAKALTINLSLSGYTVVHAETAKEAKASVEKGVFDLLLLDVNLPDGNGIDLFHELRGLGIQAPAIFLSARVDEETIVRAMSIGADDYIRKPFGMEELKLRMTRTLRAFQPVRNTVQAGPLTLDLGQRTAILSNQPLVLSRREFDILTALLKRPGDVVSREAIINYLEQDAEIYDRTIDSHISHLRRKIRDLVGEEFQVLSIYGVGYKVNWGA